MNGVFALFKGENGAGKTVAAASFPDPIILDLDLKGPAVVKKHFPNKTIPYQQFGNALQAGDLLERWDREGCPFQTIVCDGLTALSYSAIKTLDDFRGQSILSVYRDLQENQKKKTPAKAFSEIRGFDYYNVEDSFLKFYIDALKKLWAEPGKTPYHVIVTAHVLTSESTNIQTGTVTKTRRIVTAGQKIAAYVPAQFDDVWQFYVKPGDILGNDGAKHFCYTEAVGDDFAKTAYLLPKKIDFTNVSFFDLIKDQIGEHTISSAPQQEIKSTTAKSKLNF